jgi:glycosyltransferase involved in cell wall biosynthesis
MKVLFLLEKEIVVQRLKHTGWLKTYIHDLVGELSKSKVDVKIDKDGRYDVVDVHVPLIKGLKYAVKKDTPVILRGHTIPDSLKYDSLGYFKKLFLSVWLRLFRRVDMVIAPSNYAKEELGRIFDCEIRVISNGVNLRRFKYDKKKRRVFRKKYGIKKDEFVILSVGGVCERKGFRKLCEVLEQVKGVKLVVCGVKQKDYEFPRNTVFTGFIDNIDYAYCGSDTLVSLAKQETQGLTLLEAAACRLPLVLSDLSVFKEWLAPDKDCLMSDDVKTLSSFFEKLKNDKTLRKKLSGNAYKKVKSKHDIKLCAKKVVDAYNSLLDNPVLQ